MHTSDGPCITPGARLLRVCPLRASSCRRPSARVRPCRTALARPGACPPAGRLAPLSPAQRHVGRYARNGHTPGGCVSGRMRGGGARASGPPSDATCPASDRVGPRRICPASCRRPPASPATPAPSSEDAPAGQGRTPVPAPRPPPGRWGRSLRTNGSTERGIRPPADGSTPARRWVDLRRLVAGSDTHRRKRHAARGLPTRPPRVRHADRSPGVRAIFAASGRSLARRRSADP